MRVVRIEHDGSRGHGGTRVTDLETGCIVPCQSVHFSFISHYDTGAFEITELQFNQDGAVGLPVETILVKEFVWKETPSGTGD